MSFLMRLRGTPTGILDLAWNEWTNVGVTVGNTQLVTGGHALTFTSGTYLVAAPNSNRNIPQNHDFTISLRFKTSSSSGATAALTTCEPVAGGDWGQRLYGRYGGAYTPCYEFHRTGGGTDNLIATTPYQADTNKHIAIVRKNNVVTMYIDGVSVSSKASDEEQIFGERKLFVGFDGAQTVCYFVGEMDDICLLDTAVWDSDFIPPTGYLTFNDVIYLSGEEAWGMDSNNNFSKLANNYNALTNAQKIAMFDATKCYVPTIAQLQTLTMPIKAVNYQKDNAQPSCIVTAVPFAQTITPKGRISLMKYTKITGVTITGAATGNGVVKIAMTKDNSTYQVYDTTNNAWTTIDIADIGTDGMTISKVGALTSAEWIAYDCMTTGIGFAYYLEIADTTDTAYTDELSLNVELLGELTSMVKGTDYDYAYVSNTVLQVKLYTNGDFRINYNPGANE